MNVNTSGMSGMQGGSQLPNQSLPSALQRLHCLGPAMSFADEIYALINHVWLFSDLEPEEIGLLCGHMECFDAEAGTRILQEGDVGEFLFIVLEGEIEVVKESGPAEAKRITSVGPGATLGEMSLIEGMPRFASCIAETRAVFAVLTKDALHDFVAKYPVTGNKLLMVLLQVLSRRLRETSEKLLPFVTGTTV